MLAVNNYVYFKFIACCMHSWELITNLRLCHRAEVANGTYWKRRKAGRDLGTRLDDTVVPTKPNQSLTGFHVPKRSFGKTKMVERSCQSSWFSRWPFSHYDEGKDALFCQCHNDNHRRVGTLSMQGWRRRAIYAILKEKPDNIITNTLKAYLSA